MRYPAVLFDMDGTLIDSTHLYREACIHAFTHVSLPFSGDDFDRLYPTGAIFRDWIASIAGDEVLYPIARDERDRKYIELLAGGTEFLDGAENLLAHLAKHPTAVVTGSWKSFVDAVNKKLHLSRSVRTIVDADDMLPFRKPHPHGLLLAADRLGIEPKGAIYIGDQIFDLHAAKAAGMTACLIRGSHTPVDAEKEADVVVSSLGELLTML